MNASENASPGRKGLMRLGSHPFIAVVLLFVPAVCSVIHANSFADRLYDPVSDAVAPLLQAVEGWSPFWSALFGGNYGLVAMLPFLLLYALPTVLLFSVILSLYKSSGLTHHISYVLHPYLKYVGINGDDLVRVVMGFGCNVPAVVSSRACDQCGRGACISAISFGAACSYQLPATFAVFAAADCPQMGLVYLILIAVTTLIYLRFTTPKHVRAVQKLKNSQPSVTSVSMPQWRDSLKDALGELQQFAMTAVPIFVAICFITGLLEWCGVLAYITSALTPLMALFNLPGEAVTAVVLGSIRKDGIAVGLLNQEAGVLSVALETPIQVLTAVYLAGVFLPCIVTLVTIIREMRWKFALTLCLRQILWASGFSLCIAWGGSLFI